MSKCAEISAAVQRGRAAVVKDLVKEALEGIPAETILNEGLLAAMDVVGEQFKNGDLYVPEMMAAARAMNAGMEILKPHLIDAGVKPIGKAALGTVKGDLHDIGKNLVRMMFEGKGIEVVDLGVDVPADRFLEAYENDGATIIACSALLTTTMNEMQTVVELFKEKGHRDAVTIMIGGAPITQAFCELIGADYYSPDAASSADLARKVLLEGK